jgi:glutathione S-transferase
MKLYDALPSTNAKRVRVLARELGVPLELVAVDLRDASAAYREKNPMGKVPTLDDDGFMLWESGAILAYLAGRESSALWPRDPHAQAQVLRWMFFTATHVQPWVSALGQERLIKPIRGLTSDSNVIAYAERELARFLPVLDQALAGREYLCDAFSLADIFAGCTFFECERRGVSLEPYPSLAAWRARLQARPAWKD